MSRRRGLYNNKTTELIAAPVITIGESYANALELVFTTPNSENPIDYYEVYLSNVYHSRLDPTKYLVGNLDPSTSYLIKIKAVDILGNESDFSNQVSGTTNTTYLSASATEIWFLYKFIPSSTYAIEIKRSSDNAVTDVEFDGSGWVSLSSNTSAGQTLGAWIGSDDGIVNKVYGQKGFKDLFLDGSYKLIIGGNILTLFNTAYPTIRSSQDGIGLKASAVNSGSFISDTSMFGVYGSRSAADNSQNRAYGWASSKDDGILTERKHFNIAADNSLRFNGGAITNNSVPVEFNKALLRSTFKQGDSFLDYINGVKNLDSTLTTGNIKDDFFIGPYSNTLSNSPNRDFDWSGCIIFLDSKEAKRPVIEDEIDKQMNII